MSNEAITWCSKLHPGPGPKAVLFCLADKATDHSGEDWTCFPSIKAICDFTDLSQRTVERHLKALRRAGFISRNRRRRADGKLGIYDYQLHRDTDRRAELKAARETVEDIDAAMETGDQPHDNLAGGPPANLDAATRQIVPQPPANLAGQEPSEINPQRTLTPGAREPGSQGWEAALAAWPESGRKRTSWPDGQAQWARCCAIEPPGRLLAALAAAAVDPVLGGGDYGFPGLHTFLAQDRWRNFLPAQHPVEAAPRIRFAGPEELRAAVAARGDAIVLECLDRATWAEGVVTPRTGWAASKLFEIRKLIEAHGATLAPRGA